MVNVLLTYYNFDGEWAYPHLEKYVKGAKVLILPLAYREFQAWDNDSFLSIYGKGGEKYPAITRPFLSYGLKESDLDWLNPYEYEERSKEHDEQIKEKRRQKHLVQINNADLLFFTGGMPEKAIKRMDELGITDAVKNFKGVVMGASAGAMLQLETYHITPDEDYAEYGMWHGLGLVSGFDLEVHYLATPIQQQCSRRALQENGLPIYQMWHEGGLVVVDNNVTVMGNVELLVDDSEIR